MQTQIPLQQQLMQGTTGPTTTSAFTSINAEQKPLFQQPMIQQAPLQNQPIIIRREPIIREFQAKPVVSEIIERPMVEVHNRTIIKEVREKPIIEFRPQIVEERIVRSTSEPIIKKITHEPKFVYSREEEDRLVDDLKRKGFHVVVRNEFDEKSAAESRRLTVTNSEQQKVSNFTSQSFAQEKSMHAIQFTPAQQPAQQQTLIQQAPAMYVQHPPMQQQIVSPPPKRTEGVLSKLMRKLNL